MPGQAEGREAVQAAGAAIEEDPQAAPGYIVAGGGAVGRRGDGAGADGDELHLPGPSAEDNALEENYVAHLELVQVHPRRHQVPAVVSAVPGESRVARRAARPAAAVA